MQDIETHSGQTILGSISVSPSTVRAGETILIEVKSPEGASYPHDFGTISIGGLLTARRYTSFARPGKRAVIVCAYRGDGTIERTRLEIDVQPPSESQPPSLEVEPELEDGARVRFRVRMPGAISHTDDHRLTQGWRAQVARALSKRTRRLRKETSSARAAREELARAARAFVATSAHDAATESARAFVAEAARAAVAEATRVAVASGVSSANPETVGAAAAGKAGEAALRGALSAVASIPSSEEDFQSTTYTWDFGFGPHVSTLMPTATYDFEPRLDMIRPRSIFHVKVEVRPSGKPAIELRRTISVVNPYYAARVRGVIRPIVRSDVNAALVMDQPRHYRASLTVTNMESETLTLTNHRFEPLYDPERPGDTAVRIDPELIGNVLRRHLDTPGLQTAKSPRRMTTRSRFFTSRPLGAVEAQLSNDWIRDLVDGQSITIGPKKSASVEVRLPDEALPRHAVGFAVHYRGMTASGKQVRASAWFDIPARWRRVMNLAPSVAALLQTLASNRLVERQDSISATEIRRLSRRSSLSAAVDRGVLRAAASFDASSAIGPITPHSGHTGGEFVEGAECDPYDLPSVIPEGWVCQATDEKEYRWVPARFVNARQGDLILSPGGSGPIAQLLREVDPPQFYSHCGIMTKNQTEVTHSTASIGRLLDYPEGVYDQPTEGLRPDVLKYLWPGVVRQKVGLAVDGEGRADPESQEMYSISGFNPDYSVVNGEIVPALVVKPDPFQETAQVRAKLREVGAFAAQQADKSHYRLFCYTDPTAAVSLTAPESSGWAAGTYPSVCSSFVWLCALQNDVVREGGSLEADDTSPGVEAEPSESGEDGLYRYRAGERLNAGEFLYQYLYDMVYDSAEQDADWLGDVFVFLADIADDVANQVVNTFASDWADTAAKDSEAWRDTADADAVSPDNLLRWDGPDRGGLWGSSEPLIYRTARYELVPTHVWRKVDQVGSLHGTILFEEAPVEGATLELSGGQFAAFSDGSGAFAFVDVPAGHYQLTAYRVLDDGTLQTTVDALDVEVRGGGYDEIVVRLSGPDPDYREVTFEVRVTVRDWEFAAAAHPQDTEYYNGVAHLGPSDAYVEMGPYECICDNDVLGQGWIDFEWKPDRSVHMRRRVRLYDGVDTDDEHWDHAGGWKEIGPGGTRSGSTSLSINDHDKVSLWVRAHNKVEQA